MTRPNLADLSDAARALVNATGTAFILPYSSTTGAGDAVADRLCVAADKLSAVMFDAASGNTHVIVDGLERAVLCNVVALEEAFLCVQAARSLR